MPRFKLMQKGAITVTALEALDEVRGIEGRFRSADMVRLEWVRGKGWTVRRYKEMEN